MSKYGKKKAKPRTKSVVERKREPSATKVPALDITTARPADPDLSTTPTENAASKAPVSGTLQQRRARFALERIQALAKTLSVDDQKKFNSYASAMPFMIQANGLGQTAAFYRRKGTENIEYELYKLLGDWLSQADQPFAGKPDLLTGITQTDMSIYLAAQAEAMLFLDWVKKFANAFMANE